MLYNMSLLIIILMPGNGKPLGISFLLFSVKLTLLHNTAATAADQGQ